MLQILVRCYKHYNNTLCDHITVPSGRLVCKPGESPTHCDLKMNYCAGLRNERDDWNSVGK